MKPKIGDVYLTKFHPGQGAELEKFRPSVVVATQDQHHDPRFVTITAFTTRLKPKDKKLELLIENPALEKKSLLLTWYLRTIDTNRLLYKLGTLSLSDLKKTKSALRQLFS